MINVKEGFTENFDITVELLLTTFMKLDIEFRQAFLKDIESYFETAIDVLPKLSDESYKWDLTIPLKEVEVFYIIIKEQPDLLSTQLSKLTSQFNDGMSVSSKKINQNATSLFIKEREGYIDTTCVLAKLYFKILYCHNTYTENQEEKIRGMTELLFQLIKHCGDDKVYMVLSALSGLFIKSKDDKLNVLSLSLTRQTYKANKAFGEEAALAWLTDKEDNFMKYFSAFEITFESILSIFHIVNTDIKTPSTIII